jgi:lipoprotein NlpI
MPTALRGFVFNRIVAVGALVAAGLFFDGPASAQTQQQIDWCVNKGDTFSPDLRISGCTASIQSGRWSGRGLAWAFNNRGLAYAKNGQYDRAIADYDQAIRLNPQDANAFNNRGVAYDDKSQYDRAIQDYDQAIRLNPQDGDYFNNRCIAYRNKGQYDRAIQDCDQAIRLNPQDADYFNNRCIAYRNKGQYDRAIQDCDQAIRLNPQDADHFNNRGNAYSAKGDYDRAIADYSEVIRLDPKNARAYISRGRAYLYGGSLAKAQSNFKQASDLNPNDAYIALWLDITERRNNIPSHLSQSATQLDMKAWPAMVVRLFLGEMTPSAVLAAADDKDPKTKQGQECEANFYSGELALIQGAKDEAIRLFRLAASDCPKGFIEWGAANLELKALGVAP